MSSVVGSASQRAAPLELHAATATPAGNSRINNKPLVEPLTLSAKLDPLSLPEPPDDMPDEGCELWEKTLPWLVQVNVIQTIDLPSFEQMCRVYAVSRGAQKVLDEQGMFSLGSSGQLIEHPAIAVLQAAQMMFLRHAGEFGMTTMARTRLGLMDVQRKSIEADMDWTLGPSTRRSDADVERTG